ncbi:hypothetical protein AERO9A_430025 [Aeromonas salmonicida]|nr:hypothetical protein AERO9A_430025 [Aeromonas salmonicida]
MEKQGERISDIKGEMFHLDVQEHCHEECDSTYQLDPCSNTKIPQHPARTPGAKLPAQRKQTEQELWNQIYASPIEGRVSGRNTS